MARATLVNDELLELRQLVKGSDSIELKLTVPEQLYRSTNRALGSIRSRPRSARCTSSTRPTSRSTAAGVVARARRIQGRGHDSVIKLRPVVPDRAAAGLRAAPSSSSRSTRCPAATSARAR